MQKKTIWKTNNQQTVSCSFATQIIVLCLWRTICSTRCLPFKCGITEDVSSVYMTVPKRAPEEKKGYAVITDTLSTTPDKCSQPEPVT